METPRIDTWAGKPFRARSWTMPPTISLGLFAAAGPIHTFGAPWWGVLPATLLVFVGGAAWKVLGARFHDGIRVYMLAAAFIASFWLTWSTVDRVWREPLLAFTLSIAALLAILALLPWQTVRERQIAYEARRWSNWIPRQPQMLEAAPTPVNPHATLWEGIFADLNLPGITFINNRVGSRAGKAVRMRLPANGRIRYDQVANAAEGIAIALSHKGHVVPPDAITVERARDDGRISATDFIVHVDLVNVLSKIVSAPVDHEPTTIKKAFRIGVLKDGSIIYMTITEIHWLIIALTRAGKSNLLHRIIEQLSRCVDVVIFMADGKGARTAKRWIAPFLDGAPHPTEPSKVVPRPVLDWVAVDRFEYVRMLQTCIGIAEDRPFRSSGSKTEPTPENPHIVLIVDEASEFVGQHSSPAYSPITAGATSNDIANLETRLTALGAGEAVTMIKTSQRLTVTMAGKGDSLANFKGRVCLGAADQQDARMVFPKSYQAANLAASLQVPGALLISHDAEGDRLLQGRVDFMGDGDDLDSRCYESAQMHSIYAPGLTEGGAAYEIACQYGYADRWTDTDRIGWVFGTHKGKWTGKPLVEVPEEPAKPDPRAVAPPAVPASTAPDPELTARPGSFFPAKFGRPTSVAAGASDDPLSGIAVDPKWVEELAQQMEQALGGTGEAGQDSPVQPESQSNVERLVGIVDSFGAGGCSATQLINALVQAGMITAKTRSQMYRWLTAAMRAEEVWQPGGRGGRYYTTRHLQQRKVA